MPTVNSTFDREISYQRFPLFSPLLSLNNKLAISSSASIGTSSQDSMEALGTPEPSNDSSLAFDLLNADGSDSDRTPRLRRRPISKSFDSDHLDQRAERGAVKLRSNIIRQPLLRAIHHELSLLAAEADGVSEKVKRIINRQRQRLHDIIEETTTAPRRLQSKITAPLDKRRRQFHGKIRKAVTGDPLKSVRLHLEEKRSKPPVMRMMDKAAFTVGVLTMIVSEYVLLMMPERFWLWYSVMIPVLLLMRYPDYRQRKWLFFYLDFCYYVQLFCALAIFAMPNDCRLNKIIFMYAMGPLCWAVPLWRNSLVFHDVDKMTSCFIHLFPSWLALTLRWCPRDPWRGGTVGAGLECAEGVNGGDVGMAIFVYLLWQVLYYIKTEHHEKAALDADPEIQTSLRWLTTNPKNPMHQVVLSIMRKLRLFKKDETFDPTTFKTKIIFMGSQVVYTMVVCLPTPFLYNSKAGSLAVASFVFLMALWNSSNYYIDVFSRRYWQSLEEDAAAKTEALLAKAALSRARDLAHENGEHRRGAQRAMSEQFPDRSFSGMSGVGSTDEGEGGLSWSDEGEKNTDSSTEGQEGGEEEEEEVASNGVADVTPEKSKDS